jgi:hypothetical protein
LLIVSKEIPMNHPLPKSVAKPVMAYEFVPSSSEDGVEDAVALPAPAHARDESGKAPIASYSGRLREQLALASETDDPYEAYRKHILQTQAERVEHVRRTMPPLPAQPLSSEALDQLRQRNYIYDPQQYYSRAIDAQPPGSATEAFFPPSIWNRGVAMACIVAVAAGATVGFALTQKTEIGAAATQTLAYVGAMLPADQPAKPAIEAAAAGSTTILKKPIATATLDVGDVTGSLNSAIALPLRADPASAEQDLSIRLTGLPGNAILTPGRKVSEHTWVLKDEDLASARLIVPDSDTPVFDISVAAIETSTGELAAPVREMKLALRDIPPSQKPVEAMASVNQSVVTQSTSAGTALPVSTAETAAMPAQPAARVQITPANAAPEAPGSTKAFSVAAVSPIPPADKPTVITPPPSPIATGLLQKGDVLFKAGDLMMARQFYLRAHDLGAAEGALGVARTYDPAVFKELKVEGLLPDAAQAREWYRKASLTGLPEAVNALARFETTAALP